jgi:hypothetical protein
MTPFVLLLVGHGAGQEPATSPPQPPPVRLAGNVVDAGGQPVVNAAITVELDGVRVAATRSDATGLFVVGKAPAAGVRCVARSRLAVLPRSPFPRVDRSDEAPVKSTASLPARLAHAGLSHARFAAALRGLAFAGFFAVFFAVFFAGVAPIFLPSGPRPVDARTRV